MKESLKKFIFESMENGVMLTDSVIAKFVKGEPNFCLVEFYKSMWRGFNNCKCYFSDLVKNGNYSIIKFDRFPNNTKHGIRDNSWPENQFKYINKTYFDYLKKQGANIIKK